MHVRTISGIALIFLALALSLFHFLANKFFLYFTWWWSDIVMHFLGGVLVGGFVLWLIRFEAPLPIRSRIPFFLTAFAAISMIGISWEVFEYMFDIHAAQNYTFDTAFDLLSGIAGTMSVYLAMKRI